MVKKQLSCWGTDIFVGVKFLLPRKSVLKSQYRINSALGLGSTFRNGNQISGY
jgi:hypothetical protein